MRTTTIKNLMSARSLTHSLTIFLLACMCSLSAWAADISVIENYSSAPSGGATATEREYTGCNFVWKYNYGRTKTSDVVKVSDSETQRAIWLTNHTNTDANQVGYLKTTLEGGLKAVAFKFTQGATADADDHLYISIDINGVEADKIDGGVAVDKNSPIQSYSKSDFNVQEDDIEFAIKCTSTSTRTNPEHVGRILVGNVTITPYLLYTLKETSVGLQQHGFKNADLINNTGGGSIVYTSNAENVATVDANGIITPVGVGNAIITATWDNKVSTTYTLHVVDGIINENFSQVVQTGSSGTTGSEWTGAVCKWDTKYARRGANDIVRNGKQCSWLTLDGTTRGYLKTKNLEGGVKTVAFNYAQFGAEKGKVLKWKVSAIGTNTISDEIERDGDSGENKTQSIGDAYTHDFNCTENAQLEILNASVLDDGTQPTSNARILIGDIYITPYLLYTTKEVTINTLSAPYKNNDLIDNTGGEGTIEYSSTKADVATVDNEGNVVVVGPGMTEIKATWGNISTSYILYVDDVITEDYSKAPTGNVEANTRLSFDGNNFTWYYRNARSQTTDKLRNNDRGFWMSRGSGSSCYLESETEGGIKKVDFNWRQWTKDEHGYQFVMQIMTKDDAVLDNVSFTGAADYWNNDQSYSKVLSIRKNKSKLKINNLSTSNGTTAKGKLLVGPITITPYLLYTRKSASVELSNGTFANSRLINNTASETGSLTFTSSNTTVAEVNANGEVTLHVPGTTVITAKFTWEDNEYVSTSYTLYVVESISLIEDYSKTPEADRASATYERKSFVGNFGTMYYRNVRIYGTNDKLIDGTKGFWMNHTYNPDKNDKNSCYVDLGDNDNLLEGGIKNVSFKWHQFGNGSNQTIKLQIKINNTVKETIEEVGGDSECPLATTDQPYNSSADVYSKTNAKLTIANVSYKTGDESTDVPGRVIIGPVSITPYLFYLDKVVNLKIGDRYVHPLLDNTDNEGNITYSISPAGIATINSCTGEIVATAGGEATVKATWSEGAYTTYTLKVAYDLPDNTDNSSVITSLDTKTVNVRLKDRTIYRDGYFNTICLPFALSAEQIATSPLAGATIMAFTNAYVYGEKGDGQELEIRFDRVNEMAARTPYLIEFPVGENIVSPVFENVTISNGAVVPQLGSSLNFVGILAPAIMDENNLFLETNNEVYWVNGTLTDSENTLRSFRAYFAVPDGMNAAPLKKMSARLVTDSHTTPTAIEENVSAETVQKRLENGQIIILRGEEKYNIIGARQ